MGWGWASISPAKRPRETGLCLLSFFNFASYFSAKLSYFQHFRPLSTLIGLKLSHQQGHKAITTTEFPDFLAIPRKPVVIKTVGKREYREIY